MGHGDTRGENLMSAESAYPRDTVAVLITALPCVDLLQDPAHCRQRQQQAKIEGGDCRMPAWGRLERWVDMDLGCTRCVNIVDCV